MPDVLSDPPLVIYIVLFVAVVILGSIAMRRQKRADVINFGIAAVLLGVLFLIDTLVESPREMVEKELKETNELARARKYEQAAAILSPKFKWNDLNHDAVVALLKAAEGRGEGAGVLSQGRGTYKKVDSTTVEQGFEIFPTAAPVGKYRYHCVGTFKPEDGKWRMVSAKVFELGDNGERTEVKQFPAMP
jgi:hypothetical protein